MTLTGISVIVIAELTFSVSQQNFCTVLAVPGSSLAAPRINTPIVYLAENLASTCCEVNGMCTEHDRGMEGGKYVLLVCCVIETMIDRVAVYLSTRISMWGLGSRMRPISQPLRYRDVYHQHFNTGANSKVIESS